MPACLPVVETNANPNPVPDPDKTRRVWRIVSHSPLASLWDLQGVAAKTVARRTWRSLIEDRIFGRAAELGFYFFFALFPMLFCAGSIFGMVVRSAHKIYDQLLGYLAVVVPHSGLALVLTTFNQTAAGASFGKITLSFIGAVWSASVGISAIQDTLNDVYKIPDSRSYLGARMEAMGITFVVSGIVALALVSMFGGDFVAKAIASIFVAGTLHTLIAIGVRLIAWILAAALLILNFAVVYYWAPDWRARRWRYLTPGSAIGAGGWIVASLGLRMYLRYFNNYSVTYGSLGAVIILLTWFYITGLMLLAGGEINSEIEAAATERRLQTHMQERPVHHDQAA
jgi:membrane protein